MDRRHSYAIPWALMLLCAAAGVIAPELASEFGAYALLASVVVFGLPHGACDLWAFAVARGRGHSKRSTLLFLALYVFAAALTLSVWVWSAQAALVLFLILTAWHFGSGDARLEHRTRLAWLLAAAGRGLLVICAPLAFRERESAAVLEAMASVAGGSGEVSGALRVAPWLLVAGLASQLGGTLAALRAGEVDDSSDERMRAAARVWIETALLVVMFWFAPPLLAVACYFMAVHAWRHILRLDAHARFSARREGGLWRIVRDFYRRAALFTLLALAGLALFAVVFPAPFADPARWTTLYLVLLSILTVPHAGVVGWLDRREGRAGSSPQEAR